MSGDPRLVFVVSPYQNAFFHELADVLVDEIGGVGGRAAVVSAGPLLPDADDVYVLLPPHEYMTLEGESWALEPHLLGRTIFISAEQPGSPFFGGNLAHAAGAGAVFDFSPLSVRVYRQRGVQADVLPFGYARSWDRMQATPSRERPLDVMFMGCATERRLRLLAGMSWLLQGPRTSLWISDNSKPNTTDSSNFMAGSRKRDTLASTNVLLNLHQTDEPYFEWLRVTEAAHCGAVVVTEPSVGTGIFEPGEHLLVATVDSIPHVVQAVLEDTNLQERLRKAAYERLHEVPAAQAAERLLESAARLCRMRVPRQVATPERTTPLERPMPEFERQDVFGDLSLLRQAARETRLDLMDLRRHIQRLDHVLHRGGQAPLVTIAHETPTRRDAVAAPAISVITALYNHRDHVEAALDSVVASTVRDVELIVVDDGSTDGSGDVVARWLRKHPHVPGVLLAHPVNRGLPAARNSALSFVRAPLTFVLDADNEVLPLGLQLLSDALERDPEAAFAYGLLERFDESGPLGLMGYDGWDPDYLRHVNYIDAMALIRSQRLRASGGYSTDRRLYGWEDYALWCQIAEDGGHAAHVKIVVGRYRASATSMLATTNISRVAAWTALQERCPKLFAPTPDTNVSDPLAPLAARIRQRHQNSV